MSVSIRTRYAHCDEPINIEVDSLDGWSLSERDATPLLFSPHVD